MGAFSTLVCDDLGGALGKPLEGSIDLLHVNLALGAQPSDLGGWLEKMSARGVVLVSGVRHESCPRNWRRSGRRCRRNIRCSSFDHAGGLGVAFVGREPWPDKIQVLVRAIESGGVDDFRAYFSRLGASIAERHALRSAEAQIAALKTKVASERVLAAADRARGFRDRAGRRAAQRCDSSPAPADDRRDAAQARNGVFQKGASAATRSAHAGTPEAHDPAVLKTSHPAGDVTATEPILSAEHVFSDSATDFDLKLNAQIRWLEPYFSSVGLDDDLAVTFLALRAAGYPVYINLVDAQHVAEIIRTSGYFDEEALQGECWRYRYARSGAALCHCRGANWIFALRPFRSELLL